MASFQCKRCKGYIGMSFAKWEARVMCWKSKLCPKCMIETGNKEFAKIELEIMEEQWKNSNEIIREDKEMLKEYSKTKVRLERIIRNGEK
jgi:uncharacterized protein (DUF2225 family)